jgi:cytoskeletal protein RodZ
VTTREHARPRHLAEHGNGDGPLPDSQPGPPAGQRLGDRFVEAREAKGVDLLRAERETKIRRHFLAAMERSAWDELPAPVYAKGFVRNYAAYLRLDPVEAVAAWRRERGEASVEPPLVTPRPVQAPPRGIVIGPGLLVAALVSLGAVAIVVFIGFQLLRFAEPPIIRVTDPAEAITEVPEETATYTLRGETVARGEVTIRAPGQQDVRVLAGGDGTWRTLVDLRRGENRFLVSAIDPSTGKESEEPVEILIRVPFVQIAAPTIELTSPEAGLSVENGAIPVRGVATDATSLTIGAAFLGPAPGEPAPEPPAERPPDVPAESVELAEDGTFATAIDLTAGHWAITVTAVGDADRTTTLTREVTVAWQGIAVVIEVREQRTWLKVWVDGVVSEETGAAGVVLAAGRTLTVRGDEVVELRTGKMFTTYVTVNGTQYGPLGTTANPGTFRLEPGLPPRQLN